MMMMNDDQGHHSSFGCHVAKSDGVAPGSVVNNKVRDGNEDSLRMKTTKDDYVIVRCLPCCCQ